MNLNAVEGVEVQRLLNVGGGLQEDIVSCRRAHRILYTIWIPTLVIRNCLKW